jgi:hypothetical protein
VARDLCGGHDPADTLFGAGDLAVAEAGQGNHLYQYQ